MTNGRRRSGAWLGLLFGITILAYCLACGTSGGSTSSAGPDDGDLQAAELAQVRGLFDCAGAGAAYCAALDRFATASAPATTSAPYSLAGYGYSTWDHAETVYWFVARPSELMGYGDVIAESGEETVELNEVLQMLRTGQAIPTTHPVAVYVQSLATGGEREPHATDLRGRSRHYPISTPDGTTDVFVRQAGSEIIAVERNDSGATVAVFPRR